MILRRVRISVMKMFTSNISYCARKQAKAFTVTVIGAAGGIGQPLSLLLKQNPLVGHLKLYDMAKVVPGVGVDLSHINSCTSVHGYSKDCLKEALKDVKIPIRQLCSIEEFHHLASQLIVRSHWSERQWTVYANTYQIFASAYFSWSPLKSSTMWLQKPSSGANIVVIPAGMPRKPGMKRDDLFTANASIAYNLGNAIADCCPCAFVAIITNPVNSTVPILAEAMFRRCKFDPRKIFGVTTLDLVRAETFCSELNGSNPADQRVPVIGGHAGVTIIPLLSQAQPCLPNLSEECRAKLTHRIQHAGTEVIQAKDGGGSATLSMAYAAARFTNSLLKALSGSTVVEYAYVRSDVAPVHYFSSPILLSARGIECILKYGHIDELEKRFLLAALPIIRHNIREGMEFATSVKEVSKLTN